MRTARARVDSKTPPITGNKEERAATTTMSAAAALTFWDRAPPYALVALAALAGVPLELKPDPKAGKDRAQVASERIMAAIARLQLPPETIV